MRNIVKATLEDGHDVLDFYKKLNQKFESIHFNEIFSIILNSKNSESDNLKKNYFACWTKAFLSGKYL